MKLKIVYQEKEIVGLREDLGKIIHTQFLMDVRDICGEETFKLLRTSIENGCNCYSGTVSRLVPNHQELFDSARKKVICEEKFRMLQKINSSQNDGIILTVFHNLWFFVPFAIWVYTLTEWLAGWEISSVLINASIAGVIAVIIMIYLKLSR